MAVGDVPPDDMVFFASRDPLDAALRGETDDPALGALVGDLRSAYLAGGDRPRSDALTAFAGPADGPALGTIGTRPDPASSRRVPLRRRAAVGVAAFAATLAGKVVLGGAVAAATLGGLHATDVVDVPLLPHDSTIEGTPPADPALPDVADPHGVLGGPAADSGADPTSARRDDATAARPAHGSTDGGTADPAAATVLDHGAVDDDGREPVTRAPATDPGPIDRAAPAGPPAEPLAPTPAPATPEVQAPAGAPERTPADEPDGNGGGADHSTPNGSVRATSSADQKVAAGS